jgi:hypothetical protein
MLKFVQNLCHHEMWENGTGVSFLALAYGALFVFYEQMGDLPQVVRLLQFLLLFENHSINIIPELSTIRQKLIQNAAKLTNSADLITRLDAMSKYDFHDILRQVQVPKVTTSAENSDHLQHTVEPLELVKPPRALI